MAVSRGDVVLVHVKFSSGVGGKVRRTVGSLPTPLMDKINDCLKNALALP